MKQLLRKSTKRKIKIAMITVGSILLVIGLSVFLLIHSYINRMHLVVNTEEATNGYQYGDEELETQDFNLVEENSEIVSPEVIDSKEEDIINLETQILENMEENSTPIMKNDKVFNILLIGSDSRTSKETGRSDAMIILSINKNTKTITTTSLLRDIYLRIPGKSNNRLNSAYSSGGATLLMETIEQNFKIKVDRYASVDFYSFIMIVDAVGGVTLEVSEEEIPVINQYVREINRLTDQDENEDSLTESGNLILNGKQALGYARNRYVGNIDFERTARQREVLEQIIKKVKRLKLTKLNDLLYEILPEVTTNLTEGELFSLILSIPSYLSYDTEQWSIPVEKTYTFMTIRGMSVLGIDFNKNIEEINQRIFGNPLPKS